jgi:hypothetical protein
MVAALAFSLCAACGSSTYVLEAKYQTEPKSLEPDNKITVFVKEAADDREFEDGPESLSVSAVWDETPLGDQSRIVGARAGKEIGNVYLSEDQSVGSIVADLLEVAFRQAGFRLADAEADADLVVTASISRFWVWITPDSMTARIESTIEAAVTVAGEGGEATFDAAGYHDSRDTSRTPESFRFTLNEALYDLYLNMATQCLELEPPVGEPAETTEEE